MSEQQRDAEPTTPGWYAYSGGAQSLIFHLRDPQQWSAHFDNGSAHDCVWSYIEQALGVWDLVPLTPDVSVPEPRSTPGPSTGTPEPSQAASEAHSGLAEAMREWGQAMRGDWGGVDGRSVRDVVSDWADEIDGKRLPRSIEARRAELDLCPHGLAHWTIWCEDDCAAIAADESL